MRPSPFGLTVSGVRAIYSEGVIGRITVSDTLLVNEDFVLRKIFSRRKFAYVQLTEEEFLALRLKAAKEKKPLNGLVKASAKRLIQRAVEDYRANKKGK